MPPTSPQPPHPATTRPRLMRSATTTPAHRHQPHNVLLALAALLALFVVGLIGAADSPATARGPVREVAVAADLVPAQPSARPGTRAPPVA